MEDDEPLTTTAPPSADSEPTEPAADTPAHAELLGGSEEEAYRVG